MKVVVAVDGSKSADAALEHILNSNYNSSTEFHLLHVVVPGFAEMAVAGIPDVVANEKAEEQIVLNGMESLLTEKLGARVSTQIVEGEVADTVTKVCNRINADEVIVPSHCRQGFSRFWLGSLAEEIVAAAPCSVLVLKTYRTPSSSTAISSTP